MNGAKLSNDQFTASNVTSIVLDTGAAAGDIVEVIGYEISQFGVQGATGSTGPQGATGPSGGPTGATGFQGSTGPVSYTHLTLPTNREV